MSFTPRALIRSVASSGSAGPAIVAVTTVNTAFGTNRTAALSQAVGSGHSVIVLVKGGAGTVTSLTDNQANTYTLDGTATSASRNVFRCHNITNAPTTLDFTNTSDLLYVRVFEVSGLANAGPATALATVTGSSVVTLSQSVTTLAANAVVLAMLLDGTGYALTAYTPSGTTLAPTFGTSSVLHGFAFVQASAGAVSVSGTWGTSTPAPYLDVLSYAAM